ncbi:MAG: hypothetical protein DRI34_07675 [Deltaproteobacteria bacterium]|nr:MAG: hypothetical protein DRI34_07675 [Deltaproteobacteria bacterium]
MKRATGVLLLMCLVLPAGAGAKKPGKAPSGLLPSGRQVRQAAAELKQRLDKQQAELERRRQRLESLRQEILEQLAALEKKRSQAAGHEQQAGAAVTAPASGVLTGPEGKKRLQQMAQGLSGMTPEKAAQTVAKLPVELAVQLLLAMDDKKAGKVLGAMQPEKAAALVTAVLQRAAPQSGDSGKGGK